MKGYLTGIINKEIAEQNQPRQQMRDRRQLWAVPSRIVVQFKEWDRKELHVFRYCENFCWRAENVC